MKFQEFNKFVKVKCMQKFHSSIVQSLILLHKTFETSVSGDYAKAATRQRLNCIKNKNKIWRKTILNMADRILTPCNVAWSQHWFHQLTAPCNVACGSKIVTVNSPSGITLQCDTWLWDDMPLNLPKHPPYWNSTSSFHFHTSVQSTCHFCTSFQFAKFYPNRTTLCRKKWRHVDFQDGVSQPSWIVEIQ